MHLLFDSLKPPQHTQQNMTNDHKTVRPQQQHGQQHGNQQQQQQ